MKKRAVITGIGVISPIGLGTDAFWSAALAGKCACAPIPEIWRHFQKPLSTIWAPLPSCDFEPFGVGRIEASQMDKTQQIALACAGQAIAAAAIQCDVKDERKRMWTLRGIDADSAGIFMGTGMGGANAFSTMSVTHSMQPLFPTIGTVGRSEPGTPVPGITPDKLDAIRALGKAIPERFNPFTVAMSMPNGSGAVIGIRYGLHGRNETSAGACAAGTIAVGRALRAVQTGDVSLALAGGVEYLSDSLGGSFRSFDIVQALVRAGDNPAKANRPFDAARSGFLFAEGGGAVLVIEELEHALRRNAPIIAELAGCAETFDGHSVMIPEPSGTQVERMIRTAVSDAGMKPEHIDYVNAHGTSTPLNDALEAAVLQRIFGDRPLVNSTKGLIGHTIGASGAIEAAVTALSIRHQTTHICANLETPIPGLRYVRAPGPYTIRCALSESFAFGGHNAAVVMKAFEP